MGGHGVCSICTELFDFTSNSSAIAVVPCGHAFHHHCLVQWMGTKLTCPECRAPFRRKAVIERLFVNFEEDDGAVANPSVLKSEVDDLKGQLRMKEHEKSQMRSEKEKLEGRVEEVDALLKSAQLQYKEEKQTNHTLAKELRYQRQLQSQAEEAKKEAFKLRKKLEDLKAVEEVVKGNAEEIEERIQSGDKEQLATFAVIIRKELEMKRSEVRTLRQEIHDARKQLSGRKKQLHDKCSELNVVKEKLQLAEQDLADLEDRRRNEVLMASVAASPAAKRPKMATPTLSSSSSKASDNAVDSLQTTYINFKNGPSSSSTSSQKSGLQDATNISNVSGLSNFNLFKKSSGSGLMERGGSGSIRTGYNGMGGHEKHVQASKSALFAKSLNATSKGVAGKRKNPFGKSTTGGATPALPTLDTYLG